MESMERPEETIAITNLSPPPAPAPSDGPIISTQHVAFSEVKDITIIEEEEEEDDDDLKSLPPHPAPLSLNRTKSFSAVFTATPIPKAQMLLALLIQISEALQLYILFPFLAFMVSDMGFDEEDLGFYAGLLAACFCGTQLVSSIPIGWLSDRWGRKRLLMIGVGGSAIAILIFGSAKTYQQAVLGRMMAGLLSGNVGVLKSFLGEITDDSNVGLAFSYLSGGWGLGVIIAPIIGGLFAKPAESHDGIGATFGNIWLFREYPYLLPCVVVSAFQLVTLLLTASLMIEPQVHRRKRHGQQHHQSTTSSLKVCKSPSSLIVDAEEGKVEGAIHSSGGGGVASSSSETPSQSVAKDNVTTTMDYHSTVQAHTRGKRPLRLLDESDEEERTWVQRWIKRRGSTTTAETFDSSDSGPDLIEQIEKKLPPPPSPSRAILRSENVMLSTTSYGLICFVSIVLNETIPLLFKLDPSRGGFGFTTQQIGTLLSIGGVGLAFMSFVLYPFLHARFGNIVVYRASLLVYLPVTLCWPLQAKIQSSKLLWVSLSFMVTIRFMAQQAAFNPIMIIVNNSAPRSHLGAVNGLGQSLASGARGVGPALGGVLWSLGIRAHFIYLNFIFIALCLLATLALSYLLPPSLDNAHQKDEEPTEMPRLVAPLSSSRRSGGGGSGTGGQLAPMEIES